MARQSFAVLGTGVMGSGITRSLLRDGHEVTVWNRNLDRARALEEHGAKVAATPEAAVRAAPVFVTMLADGDATETVARHALSAATGNHIWVQMATIGDRGGRTARQGGRRSRRRFRGRAGVGQRANRPSGVS
ncbi:MAG: NAD(P)-binding domain-containing protein [Actinobacteria bacterium]|nr:NAD(P)-binding domain-containing protein [Actinomycetota bacterium]